MMKVALKNRRKAANKQSTAISGLSHLKIDKTFKIALKMLGTVSAGFPSPAEEENVDLISLDQWLIDDENSTFMITMNDDSMRGAGIFQGDVLLLKRGGKPKNYDIVVATVDDDWTIRYYYRKGTRTYLLPANKSYFPISPKYELKVEGVVYSVIRKIN